MRRLVYAPHVWIFIRSSNLGGKIFDVSTDIVRGTVTQNLGDVSTLEFELRNRYKKWLREPGHQNTCIFLPMDLVTVWMQRIAGRPIQIFTGYLDEVPYYQSYPGNAVFKASCTLKKLAFNWFDPGLPMFLNWVNSQAGWALDPSTGEALGLNSLLGGSTGNINDSGLGSLLGNFMMDICGWPGDQVLIGGIPQYIIDAGKNLLLNIVEPKTKKQEKNLTNFLKQYLDVDGWQGGPISNQDDVTLSGGKPPVAGTAKNALGNLIPAPKLLSIVDRIDNSASRNNLPTLLLVMAGILLSNMDPTFQEPEATGNPNWGYGLYALRPNNVKTQKQSQASRSFTSFTDPASILGNTIDGVSINAILDPETASEVLCRRLYMNQGTWVTPARNNDPQAMAQWIQAAIGRPLPTDTSILDAFEMAKSATLTQMSVSPIALPIDNIDPKNTSLNDASVQNLLIPQEKQVLNNDYVGADPAISKIIVTAKTISPNLRVSGLPSLQPNEVYFNGPANDVVKLYNALIGDLTIEYVQTNVTGQDSTLRRGVRSGLPVRQDFPGTGILVAVDVSKVHADAPTGAGTAPPGISLSLSQLGVFSFDASFAANFAFPSNVPESLFLTGDKALMNDTSCLDAVKQFCQASLRTFRSLPDGRFLAFYPDYFSADRKPYWKIYNIEIIDFGIQLNDDSLATHVYVVGDTLNPTNPSDWMNELTSRGVATLKQADSLKFIAPSGGDVSPLNPDEFLKHYGARPHKEEDPMIRSTFYEFFLAWQRFMYLWTQQFATNVRFTFQPEVMAGGIIEFPDHYVQMFVESVTHTFDYEAGFSTEAVLSAPQLTQKAPQSAINALPGFALSSGSSNWVGLGNDAPSTPPPGVTPGGMGHL